MAGEGKEAERALRRLVSARAAAHCMGLPRQERPDEAQAAWVEVRGLSCLRLPLIHLAHLIDDAVDRRVNSMRACYKTLLLTYVTDDCTHARDACGASVETR